MSDITIRRPQRKCIGCGTISDKSNMVRIVKDGSQGMITLDVNMCMNGRGAYLCKDKNCLAKAKKCRGLEKSFRMSVPALIYDSLEKEFVFGSK